MKYKLLNFLLSFFIFFIFADSSVKAQVKTYTVSSGESIQTKCLDLVKPGDTCVVNAGTYNESLTLRVSGSSTSRITLKCATAKECIVNSGTGKTLVTTGNMGYYTIDGFQFVATRSSPQMSTEQPQNEATVNFGYNFWGDGDTGNRGNNGFILKNCVVKGAVYIYGQNNLVENCELDGMKLFAEGLTERSLPSHHNTFRNNVIHDYNHRGGWSLQFRGNSIWEGNTIYNISEINPGQGGAIDCDNAGRSRPDDTLVTFQCQIINNTFYNIYSEYAVLFENIFHSKIENNRFYDIKTRYAISVINYGKEGNYCWFAKCTPIFSSDAEYRHLDVDVLISGNSFRNLEGDAIDCKSVSGVTVVNNTFDTTNKSQGVATINLNRNGEFYCRNWSITNNNFIKSMKFAFNFDFGGGDYTTQDSLSTLPDMPTDVGNMTIDKNNYDFSNTSAKYQVTTRTSQASKSTASRDISYIRNSYYPERKLELNSLTSVTNFSTPSFTIITPTATSTPVPTSTPTPIPGDIVDTNDNPIDEVNIFDYNELISKFFQTGSPGWIKADITGQLGIADGKVDIFDYNILIANYYK